MSYSIASLGLDEIVQPYLKAVRADLIGVILHNNFASPRRCNGVKHLLDHAPTTSELVGIYSGQGCLDMEVSHFKCQQYLS